MMKRLPAFAQKESVHFQRIMKIFFTFTYLTLQMYQSNARYILGVINRNAQNGKLKKNWPYLFTDLFAYHVLKIINKF